MLPLAACNIAYISYENLGGKFTSFTASDQAEREQPKPNAGEMLGQSRRRWAIIKPD